ncbi:MAG: hypothetical protein WB622_18955 [Acidobacteriaceae bacterium]|jgi:hypothetical protein
MHLTGAPALPIPTLENMLAMQPNVLFDASAVYRSTMIEEIDVVEPAFSRLKNSDLFFYTISAHGGQPESTAMTSPTQHFFLRLRQKPACIAV